MTALKRVGLGSLILFVLVMALVGFLSLTRGTPVRSAVAIGGSAGPPPVGDSLFARTMELFTGTHLEPGSRVELLATGIGTYPPLWRDIQGAQRTLTVQMYYSQPGAIADSMAAFL